MSTAPMCSASWLQCPQSLKSRELCQPALIRNPISSMPVYLTAVFPKFREEGRISTNIQRQLALCCSVPNLWRGRVGALQTNSVLFAERMGTAPMHNAAPLPAGLLHLTESVDGSIIAMHSISHKIFFCQTANLILVLVSPTFSLLCAFMSLN